MSDQARGLYVDSAVRDVVLPICTYDRAGQGEFVFAGLLGTGFLIGDGSWFVTATHVVDGHEDFVAMQVLDTSWYSMGLVEKQTHPNEDISLFRTQPTKAQVSWLRLDARHEQASCSYQVWGYPEDVLYDHGVATQEGRVLQRPDLVFSTGHIRRRLSHQLPGLRGNNFYELSEIAGGGSSGAPVITRMGETWGVTGIYLGERSSSQEGKPARELGYALRMDAVAEWLKDIGVDFR